MTPSEIQYYVQKRREGWENSQVRKELENQNYSKEDVFFYLNKIDDLFVSEIKNKSKLTLNNVSLRTFELIFGIVLLIIGLYLLAICLVLGPVLFNLVIGVPATSGGYYFIQKGWNGFKQISKVAKGKKLIEVEQEVLDN